MKRMALVVSAAMVVSAGLAAAQPPRPANAPTQLNPPVPSKPAEPPAILSMLATIAVIGGVLGAVMMPPKRGHQD